LLRTEILKLAKAGTHHEEQEVVLDFEDFEGEMHVALVASALRRSVMVNSLCLCLYPVRKYTHFFFNSL
jgi:hypothetical protein